jgi:hypothetical protein
VKVNKIKIADYNPRTMSEKSRRALRTSMTEFKDISGIVWNLKTGNLVSGNHRWEHLIEEFGKDNLELVRSNDADDYFLILGMGEFTGYLLREVDWDEDMEKAANIAANSDRLKGEFTNAVDGILSSIADSNSKLPKEIFKDLRFDGLQIEFGKIPVDFAEYDKNAKFDFDDDFDLEDTQEDIDASEIDSDITNIIIKDEDNEVEPIEMTSLVIKCRMENRLDIVEKIKNCLIDYNDVTIA